MLWSICEAKKTKIIIAGLTTKQATSIYRGITYSCKTISVVFINASSNRFREFYGYKKRTFDGRLLFWQYVERRWLFETSENQQIKQSKASHVSRKSRRGSKRHPIES